MIDVNVAAVAIKAVALLFKGSSEPYRAAAYALGWRHLDGTDWWHSVMEYIG